jgi:hypothetical protein
LMQRVSEALEIMSEEEAQRQALVEFEQGA